MLDAGGFHPGGMPANLFHFTGDGDVGVGRILAKAGLKALYHPLYDDSQTIERASNFILPAKLVK